MCFSSALLLILAFPQTDFWGLAWIGLIPLFFALDGKSFKSAFGTAYLCGLMVFAGTLYWFIHVTLLGMILLILYLALYYGVFGVLYVFFPRRKFLEQLLLLPSYWIVLEFVRAHALSGFGWVSLGYSQYKNLPLIQVADITGVYGISFLIVLVNIFLKKWLAEQCSGKKFFKDREGRCAAVLVGGALIVVLFYGIFRLNQPPDQKQKLKIAVIQGNIPQAMKWNETLWPEIMEKHLQLTEAAALLKPDLILWPETAFPEILGETPERFTELKKRVARLKIPLLVGAVTQDVSDTGPAYYNSAILISPAGETVGQYDKLHLVPFGEYVPLRGYLPILTDIVPIDDFTAGKTYTVFPASGVRPWKKGEHNFSVLICFEDAVTDIAREFAVQGAGFFVNITNDAWFMDTKAPFMHLQSSVFRAVETRRPIVRAANTGVSCFVDRQGHIHDCVQDSEGKKTFVSGYHVGTMTPESGGLRTVYTNFGDFFTYLCFGCILWGIIRKKGRS